MLLILMYHRVYHRNRTPDALRVHLTYLRDHYPLVLPGEQLQPRRWSICLTFDDATVDFYHQVYPLLQELKIRALLAIPTGLIAADTDDSLAQRLQIQEQNPLNTKSVIPNTSLCTWKELCTMQNSGHVHCAAHGHYHLSMTAANTNKRTELEMSRATFIEYLHCIPDTFVYPFGQVDAETFRYTRTYYSYAMRIGGAINKDWGSNGGLLYRVDASAYWPEGRIWSWHQALYYRLKRLANLVRQK